MRLKTLGLLPLPLLIAACGDDLDSRNAAAGVDRDGQSEFVVQQPRARVVSSESAAPVEDFDDIEEQEESARTGSDRGGEEDEDVVVDAAPDELIDSAQGFSAEPMDDTSGFDPSPPPPETFGE